MEPFFVPLLLSVLFFLVSSVRRWHCYNGGRLLVNGGWEGSFFRWVALARGHYDEDEFLVKEVVAGGVVGSRDWIWIRI